MCRAIVISLGLAGLLMGSGCRTATRVADVPRVDLSLEGGNRGYLVGTPPEPAPLKPTRQMLQIDVEVPSFYKPKHTGAHVGLDEMAAPEMEIGEASAQPLAMTFDIYVVQKGDSLWSIAAKPETYGKATRWRRIFDANRDTLRSPDRLRPGMTLKIPRGESGAGSGTTYEDAGTTYKK